MASPKKPPHGEPCNGCGECCKAELCPLGYGVFGHVRGPCPALEPAPGETFACGLVLHPEVHRLANTLEHGRETMVATAKMLIGTAVGCDACVADEPYNQPFVDQLIMNRKPRNVIRRAMKIWGVSHVMRTL